MLLFQGRVACQNCTLTDRALQWKSVLVETEVNIRMKASSNISGSRRT